MKKSIKRRFAATINREKLREFIQRRKINTIGLFVLTALSAVITLLCALTGFSRTKILAFVTIMLALLCAIQLFKLRRSFRTIRAFKGFRKRRSTDPAQAE